MPLPASRRPPTQASPRSLDRRGASAPRNLAPGPRARNGPGRPGKTMPPTPGDGATPLESACGHARGAVYIRVCRPPLIQARVPARVARDRSIRFHAPDDAGPRWAWPRSSASAHACALPAAPRPPAATSAPAGGIGANRPPRTIGGWPARCSPAVCNLRYTRCCGVRGQRSHKLWTTRGARIHPQAAPPGDDELPTASDTGNFHVNQALEQLVPVVQAPQHHRF